MTSPILESQHLFDAGPIEEVNSEVPVPCEMCELRELAAREATWLVTMSCLCGYVASRPHCDECVSITRYLMGPAMGKMNANFGCVKCKGSVWDVSYRPIKVRS